MEILLFQKTYLHGCNRSCSFYCLNNLFVFSTSSDSVFCIHCALFVSQENSVSTDEAISSNHKILTLCFRYVDENMEIQEKFATFLDLERLTGEHIARKMLHFYEESGINPKQCKGQCYDSTPNLQSEKKKVASFILKESENAVVKHC